jgi:uncharacterized Zn finger protein
MALASTCPACKKTSFEVVMEEPKGSNYKLLFTRCSACGAVVGVTEFYNIGTLLEKLAKKLNIRLHD